MYPPSDNRALVAKAPEIAIMNAVADKPTFLKFIAVKFTVQIHAYYFLQVFGCSCSIAIEIILIVDNGIGIQRMVVECKEFIVFYNKVCHLFLVMKRNV